MMMTFISADISFKNKISTSVSEQTGKVDKISYRMTEGITDQRSGIKDIKTK